MVGSTLAPMIADIKRVSQVFGGFKSADMLEISAILNKQIFISISYQRLSNIPAWV
jgi:hypothetical protein